MSVAGESAPAGSDDPASTRNSAIRGRCRDAALRKAARNLKLGFGPHSLRTAHKDSIRAAAAQPEDHNERDARESRGVMAERERDRPRDEGRDGQALREEHARWVRPTRSAHATRPLQGSSAEETPSPRRSVARPRVPLRGPRRAHVKCEDTAIIDQTEHRTIMVSTAARPRVSIV